MYFKFNITKPVCVLTWCHWRWRDAHSLPGACTGMAGRGGGSDPGTSCPPSCTCGTGRAHGLAPSPSHESPCTFQNFCFIWHCFLRTKYVKIKHSVYYITADHPQCMIWVVIQWFSVLIRIWHGIMMIDTWYCEDF